MAFVDINALSSGPSDCLGMQLRCIWVVDEDESYQIHPTREAETTLVVIRTLDGCGIVEVADYGRFILEAGSVLLVETARLRHYGTAGARWHFYWFEIARESGVGYPWHTLFQVTPQVWEASLLSRTFTLLAMPDPAGRSAASALFNGLLHEWAARWQRSGDKPDRLRALVFQAITRMQQDLSQPLTVDALAEELGISARWLRQAFLKVMGISPKAYYTELRLQHAARALEMQLGSVTQISEQLGYASPFHFCRAFKAQFGSPPSQYLRGDDVNIPSAGRWTPR